MRYSRQALNPAALAERSQLVERVKEVMSLAGWQDIQQALAVVVDQSSTDAAKPPTADETPFQRYYRLGFSHGVRAVAELPQRLVMANQLSEHERSRLAMASKMEVVK